jgi:branched-chain amino acid transport system permease protein
MGMKAATMPNAAPLWNPRNILGVAFFLALGALPLLGLSPNLTRLLFTSCVWVATSVAWNLLGGFAGQVSFGFAVFYGLGAYTGAMAINAGVNPYLAFLIAGAAAAAASLVIGLPTFRLRGPYFAIATIGVSEAVRVIATNLKVTGGASGYRLAEHGPFKPVEHFYTALSLAAIAVGVSVWIRKSKFGLSLNAIREDEEAAADIGVNPLATKLIVHFIAAGLTGMAGGVFARYAAFIHPQGVFAFNTSVAILLMPIIGGVGTVAGPVVGAFVYGLVQEELIARFPQSHLLLYGCLLIIIILFEPRGIMGWLRRLFAFVQRARSKNAAVPLR